MVGWVEASQPGQNIWPHGGDMQGERIVQLSKVWLQKRVNSDLLSRIAQEEFEIQSCGAMMMKLLSQALKHSIPGQ